MVSESRNQGHRTLTVLMLGSSTREIFIGKKTPIRTHKSEFGFPKTVRLEFLSSDVLLKYLVIVDIPCLYRITWTNLCIFLLEIHPTLSACKVRVMLS